MKAELFIATLFISAMSFAQQRVGINTNTPIETLDVNGNTNLRGLLKLGNNAGTSGQVLTSSGPGSNPIWQHTAFTGGGRFYISYANNSHSLGRQGFATTFGASSQEDSLDLLGSQVIGTDFTINSAGTTNNHIVINRSGPYNFVGAIRMFATIDDAVTMLPRAYIKFQSNQPVGNLDHEFYIDERMMERVAGSAVGSGVNSHNLLTQFNFNIHLAAGTTVTFLTGLSGLKYPLNGIGVSSGGFITGHFVAE